MAIPAFKNNTNYEIDVPTELGYSVILAPGRYVKGTWFDTNGIKNTDGTLDRRFTKVADADTVDPQSLIHYTASEVTSGAVGTVTGTTVLDASLTGADLNSEVLMGGASGIWLKVDPTSSGVTITQSAAGVKFEVSLGVSGYSGATGASGYSGTSGYSGWSGV